MDKSTMIAQGYVPVTCTLSDPPAGMLIWTEISKGRDPCAGCNMNRDVCKGRQKQEA